MKWETKSLTFNKGSFFKEGPFIRKIIGIIILAIITINTLLMGGCAKKEEQSFIELEYSSNYYVSEDSNSFPFQFAFNKKIEKCEIREIEKNTDSWLTHEFIEEKDDKGECLIYNGYYIYGIIFDLPIENFEFQSFTLYLNDSFEQKIDLNIEIKKVDMSENEDDIRPLSIPFIADFVDEAEWVFLSISNITLTSIELNTTEFTDYHMYLDSVIFNVKSDIEKLSKFYITIEFLNWEQVHKCDKVYLTINYEKNGIPLQYYSDYSIFGNQLEILINKIEKASK